MAKHKKTNYAGDPRSTVHWRGPRLLERVLSLVGLVRSGRDIVGREYTIRTRRGKSKDEESE